MTLLLLGVTIAGCAASQTGLCGGDHECPGGACVAGQCRTIVGADLGAADLAGRDASGGGDAAAGPDLISGAPDLAGGDGALPVCNFNSNGVIERSEAPFIVGLGALYAVNGSGPVAVDTQPSNGIWDYTATTTGEIKTFSQLISPAGTWWAADFPGATYAEPLQYGQAILGVYRVQPDRLELLGLVSEQDGAQKTRLTYATPIDVLRFPLAVGTTWTSSSSISGLAQGLFIVASDSYTFNADRAGTTRVPAGSFETLRLLVDYRETINFVTTTRFLNLHIAECYGTVARLRSRDNEASRAFTQAAEYRRLSTQ